MCQKNIIMILLDASWGAWSSLVLQVTYRKKQSSTVYSLCLSSNSCLGYLIAINPSYM